MTAAEYSRLATERKLTQELADTRELLASLARAVEHMARRELAQQGEYQLGDREEIWDSILHAQQVRDEIAPKWLSRTA